MVTKTKKQKRREAELLGMPYGVAEMRLRKSVIHELARQLDINVCRFCAQRIASSDDVTLSHLQDWAGDPSRFWDLSNLAFSHQSCEAAEGQESSKKMKRVEVTIENEQGQQLPGTKHEGTIYVAGKKGERYRIHIRNTTSKRVLVVGSVDGRNIVTGKPGDWSDNGYVLGPYESYAIEGWRESSEKVAAFRFGKKRKSYSAKMGTPEYVGVIGVAAFDEKEKPQPIPHTITIINRRPIVSPIVTPYVGWPLMDSGWVGDQVYGSHQTICHHDTVPGSAPFVGASSVGGTYGSAVTEQPTSGVLRSHGSTKQVVTAQSLGTSYGEAIADRVGTTSFTRATSSPAEVYEFQYDTAESLAAQGIMVGRPSELKKRPKAFPEAKHAEPGFCTPPTRR